MKELLKNCIQLVLMITAVFLALLSWAISLYYWRILPAVIPTHFGIGGAPDAWSDKSVFYSFLIPGLQTVMLAFFLFLYEKPQYSDMPTALLLTAMPKPHREHAFALIRIMLVGTSLWLGALFSYLTYAMNASAIAQIIGPSPYLMGSLIIGMLLWLGWYTVKVYRYTKAYLENPKPKTSKSK